MMWLRASVFPLFRQFQRQVLPARAGVDNAWEQEKLEATLCEMLEKPHRTPAPSAKCYRYLLYHLGCSLSGIESVPQG